MRIVITLLSALFIIRPAIAESRSGSYPEESSQPTKWANGYMNALAGCSFKNVDTTGEGCSVTRTIEIENKPFEKPSGAVVYKGVYSIVRPKCGKSWANAKAIVEIIPKFVRYTDTKERESRIDVERVFVSGGNEEGSLVGLTDKDTVNFVAGGAIRIFDQTYMNTREGACKGW